MKQGDAAVVILLVLPGDNETVELKIDEARKVWEQLGELFGKKEPSQPLVFGPWSRTKDDPFPKVTDMIPTSIKWPPLVRPGDQWSTNDPPNFPPDITCETELPPGCVYGEKQ